MSWFLQGEQAVLLLLGLAAMAALCLVLGFFPVDLPQEQFCSALRLASCLGAAAEESSKSSNFPLLHYNASRGKSPLDCCL